MNSALNVLQGWQIPVLVCLLVVLGLLCVTVIFLIYKVIEKPSWRRRRKRPEVSIMSSPAVGAQASEKSQTASGIVPVAALEKSEESAFAADDPAASAEEPAEVSEEEQPEEKEPEEQPAEQQPPEESAEEAEPQSEATLAAQVSLSSETSEPVAEEPAEQPAEVAEEAQSEEQPEEQSGDAEDKLPEESTAETVEEILEEHGLSSASEITEEIAEEIMSVSTHHDEESKEVVVVSGLYKKYSKKADYAVSNVNFRCYEGEIVGLLGHNGAGKSTTLKCLEGMLPFEKGEISIYGHDIVKDPINAKANMGFVTDNHAVFIKMTGMQYLAFMADVYDVPADVRKERIEKLESVFQLGDAVNNLISSYSHGMRQKICMMGSLIHMPKLWVLDEPMTGLDPRTMHAVQEFMREYADAGNCIIFSSHALITVAKMCDRVVLLRTGQQLDELNIKRIMTVDPNFDFEEYFLKHEGQV